jgi:general secretion pathway protein K
MRGDLSLPARCRHAPVGCERGAAIIVAMLVAALAATVAMAIAAEQTRWFAGVASRRDQVQAQSLAQAGVQWTRQILLEDAAGGALDYLGEPWALPLPPIPLENGSIEGRVVDAQGLVNLNNLALAGTRGDDERERAARLLARAGVAAAAVDALADWVDEDGDARPNGAESTWYARLPTPYRSADRPLLRVAEIAAVRGFDPAAVARLAPLVTALPEATALNVNTAPVAVLAASLRGASEASLAELATDRVTHPFTTIDDFSSRLPQGATLLDRRGYDVKSSYFLVTVRARQGQAIAQARALLKRTRGAWPVVVWQTIE